MKLYNSFLVRCWTVTESTRGSYDVYDAVHFQTGEHLRTDSLARVNEWVAGACHSAEDECPERTPGGDDKVTSAL